MNLSNLANDVISILKPNGDIFENIKANVQPEIIFINDEKLPLEEKDKIFRKLPSGLIETYIVIDRGFYKGLGGRSGQYQAIVKKEGIIDEDKYKSTVNIYNASGPNSRININSYDNSNNYINDTDLLFKDLKKALEKLENQEVKNKSLELLDELKKTKHTHDYLTKYQSFISVLANHMTIIAPFIPALTMLF